jgi:2-dehydro-3-deoxygalactonokinase
LVQAEKMKILAETISDSGIAQTFNNWKLQNGCIDNRTSFYLGVIKEHISRMRIDNASLLKGIPVLISGMASSTIGIFELSYSLLPLDIAKDTLNAEWINKTADFEHDALVISGLCTEADVMRGEEAQLIGCMNLINAKEDILYVFPGTHSKHILVRGNTIVSFATYMTGEFFALLSGYSILKNSVDAGASDDMTWFRKGVNTSATNSILHAAFFVRTNDLFAKCSKEENYDFLSGLLIGAELNDIKKSKAHIVLCCGAKLFKYYTTAIEEFGLTNSVTLLPADQVDIAAVHGQYHILKSKTKVA